MYIIFLFFLLNEDPTWIGDGIGVVFAKAKGSGQGLFALEEQDDQYPTQDENQIDESQHAHVKAVNQTQRVCEAVTFPRLLLALHRGSQKSINAVTLAASSGHCCRPTTGTEQEQLTHNWPVSLKLGTATALPRDRRHISGWPQQKRNGNKWEVSKGWGHSESVSSVCQL